MLGSRRIRMTHAR